MIIYANYKSGSWRYNYIVDMFQFNDSAKKCCEYVSDNRWFERHSFYPLEPCGDGSKAV